jgi:polysaccharide biosynthesis/export protein
MTRWRAALGVWLCLLAAAPAGVVAADHVASDRHDNKNAGADLEYRLQPGDLVTISVWKEKDLETEALVRPDGGLSFPLVGDVDAAGRTVEDLRAILTQRLKPYIPDPVVTVAIKLIGGNHIYVVGRVNKPGDFPFTTPVDVMQALSMAGGTTPFAQLNDIVILRRQNGQERMLRFRYEDVIRGRSLAQNVVLESGDTVVVP